MARKTPRRRSSRRTPRLDFAAIEIVGALLTPDIVARIASFEAGDQTEETYGVPPGLKVRDEIARYFRIGEALWHQFAAAKTANPAASERFVLQLLKECFGFNPIKTQKEIRKGEREFPVRHAGLNGRVPIVIAPASDESARRSGIDESLSQFGDGSRRRSATLLLQEYLNAEEDAVWGMCTDGPTLRVLRDNISLTRPAWIEADLAQIFTEGLFPDFSALWLLIHQSRFGRPDVLPADCALEHWRDAGRIEGVAARDKLRQGVEHALLELGQGFIENPANNDLRKELTDGSLTRQGYFEELLCLVYRLIFLFAAEDRELLHVPGAPQAATKAYADGYSAARLRERCTRRTSWDKNIDVWEGLKATFHALAEGEQLLGLPALGGLFARGQHRHLRVSKIENRRMLAAVWRLAWMRPEGQPLTRVNWRDMETEELGSVYEGLLELTPQVSASERRFAFAEGAAGQGNARKTSGSYYTPDALVKLLLDSTLEPILNAAEARNPDDPVAEILKLSIIDPACGSGHFLLGAARRAAARIAKHRSPGAPSQDEFQHALREIVAHCIYGVDRNPMAVELCKVALWIEALEPGKPLTFLGAQIRCGDSLIGVFDIDMLRKGIPDEAYKPLTGDDKEIARAYSRYNKQQRDGKGATGLLSELRPPEGLSHADRRLNEMPQDELRQVEAKSRSFDEIRASEEWQRLKTASDLYVSAYLYTAAFFAPKPKTASAFDDLPLTEHVWNAAGGRAVAPHLTEGSKQTSNSVAAFHWHIEFPRIFETGGFDVVIGNPPWEVSQFGEKEFFASRDPELAALSGDSRKRAIARLETDNPRLWQELVIAKRVPEAANEFFRSAGRFPLTATGKINTYALFAEHFSKLTKPEGRTGVLVPTGIATDSSTSAYFGSLIKQSRLILLYSFYEIRGWFKGTDDRKSFCVLVTGTTKGATEFCFDIREIAELEHPERRFTLTAEQIAHINPNTKTAPIFRSRADAELTAKLYARAPVLIEERPASEGGDLNPWGITFQQGLFNMTSASELFRTEAQLRDGGWERDGVDWVRDTDKEMERRVPLYEAKMVHHFDHRWATYAGGAVDDEEGARDCTLSEKQNPAFEPTPRYWVPNEEVKLRAARVPASLKRGVREKNGDRILKSLAEWLTGYFVEVEGQAPREADLTRVLGRDRAWRTVLGVSPEHFLLEGRTLATGRGLQRETPLSEDDVAFLTEGPDDPLDIATTLIDRKQPRWLMGWRDIALRSVERTLIASVFPKVGTGDTLLLKYPVVENAKVCAALNALLCSLTLDYICRQKIGGTHLKYNVFKQNVVLSPSTFSAADLTFIIPHVLELTYTSHSMRPWAEDLGYIGRPFVWDEVRRVELRAELDAFFAHKYQLTRDELRYVLDPEDAKGKDYPSETFRVLKTREEESFGEYRTQKLILAAWDRLAATQFGAGATESRRSVRLTAALPDNAWVRARQSIRGEAGALLVALLKAMANPMPVTRVRLAAILVLEPRLLHAHLNRSQSAEWRRLVGDEASPLPSGAVQFVPPTDQHWGAVVRGLRTSGALIEDSQAGTWAPGQGLDKIDTDGWPDGRARFVLDALRAADEETVVHALPSEVRRWLDAEAA